GARRSHVASAQPRRPAHRDPDADRAQRDVSQVQAGPVAQRAPRPPDVRVSSIGRRRVLATVLAAGIVAGSATLTSLAAPGGTAPAPTPVPPKGSLSPFPTALATPSNAMRPPVVSARSALLADLTTGTLMDAKDPDLPVPIASLTKVMTALITLDRTDPA